MAFDNTVIANLDEKMWRRLGVSQTFDRLLVEAAAVTPGTAGAVAQAAGARLTGGAARFWELSLPQIQRDLCRREILRERAGHLELNPDFGAKIERFLKDKEDSVSHVASSSGMTAEEIMRRAEARREREKARPAAKKKTAPVRRKESPKVARRRSDENEEETAQDLGNAARAAAPAPKSQGKLFTTLRLNRLLDHLDNTALSRPQVAKRLSLDTTSLDAFLAVTHEADITRTLRDDLVELHWKGRELARTSDADRRMNVLEAVKSLRAVQSEND
jgi:hypothetical protein